MKLCKMKRKRELSLEKFQPVSYTKRTCVSEKLSSYTKRFLKHTCKINAQSSLLNAERYILNIEMNSVDTEGNHNFRCTNKLVYNNAVTI